MWVEAVIRNRLSHDRLCLDRGLQSRLTFEPVNGLIQAAKRRARGFRSERSLIAMLAGKLDYGLPSVGLATHTK